MRKIDRYFPILHGGREVMAEILTTFVVDEDIYLAVDIGGDAEVYQILPNGLKVAPRSVFKDFINQPGKLTSKWRKVKEKVSGGS